MFKKIPWKDVCKFLAGTFFASAGVELYLYAVGVSVPFGSFTVTPAINGARSIVHYILFATFFYLVQRRRTFRAVRNMQGYHNRESEWRGSAGWLARERHVWRIQMVSSQPLSEKLPLRCHPIKRRSKAALTASSLF